ncbi:MAG: DUF4375 domain-containing protein [Pseudomonadota bacterium]
MDAPEEWRVVSAVVDYVNAMIEHGLYSVDEIPQKAMHAYHADYYLAQVNNGGHSQFIHNSGNAAEVTWRNAARGLESMGAYGHFQILAKMLAWVEANPEETAAQTGFSGGRAKELDDLDSAFYALDKTENMSQLNAAWIKSWPELQVLADERYPEALRQVASMNPKRETRLRARELARLIATLGDRMRVGLSLAAAQAENFEIVLQIGNGGYETIEGEQLMAFFVRTTRGERYGVVTETYAALYDRIPGTPIQPADPNDPDSLTKSFEAFKAGGGKPPKVGELIARVEMTEIDTAHEASNEVEGAAAIHFLLDKARLDYANATIATVSVDPSESGPVMRYLVLTEGQTNIVTANREGAILMRFNDKQKLAAHPIDDFRTFRKSVLEA